MPPLPDAPTRRPTRAEVCERLLQAAALLFAERGVPGTTIDDVASAAGFTKGAVYSNYASKTDLVIAVLERETRSQIDALRAMTPDGSTPVSIQGTLAELPQAVRRAYAPYGDGTADDFALMAELRSRAVADDRVMAVFARERRAVLDTLRELVDLVFDGRTHDVTGLSADALARVLISISVGSAFDAPATGDVSPADLMGDLIAALTRPAQPAA